MEAFSSCSPDVFIKYRGSVQDCGDVCDWSSVVDSSIEYIHCLGGDYEIPRGGGGSGSGSGSGY
jgi:hypothetical protein